MLVYIILFFLINVLIFFILNIKKVPSAIKSFHLYFALVVFLIIYVAYSFFFATDLTAKLILLSFSLGPVFISVANRVLNITLSTTNKKVNRMYEVFNDFFFNYLPFAVVLFNQIGIVTGQMPLVVS